MKKYSDLIDEIIVSKNVESCNDFAKSSFQKFNFDISNEHFDIQNEIESKYYGKEIGMYDLLSIPNALFLSKKQIKYCESVFSKILQKYLNVNSKSKILVVGLGNRHISADSLGTKVVSKVNITFPQIKTPHIMAFCPSVLGLTGMESSDIIEGVVKKIKPTHIILIDSLCASNPLRLGKSIQVSNTGLCPGSGIGNKRKCIDRAICKNIISIGVPLLIYAQTYVLSMLEDAGVDLKVVSSVMHSIKKSNNEAEILDFLSAIKDLLKDNKNEDIVTIKDIDECVEIVAGIIANAINKTLGVDMYY